SRRWERKRRKRRGPISASPVASHRPQATSLPQDEASRAMRKHGPYRQSDVPVRSPPAIHPGMVRENQRRAKKLLVCLGITPPIVRTDLERIRLAESSLRQRGLEDRLAGLFLCPVPES